MVSTMASSCPLQVQSLCWRTMPQRFQRRRQPPRSRRVCAKGVSRGIILDPEDKNTWELENRIRTKLLNPKHLPSSYDTAWVAMVPAHGDPHAPRFRGYVEWILQNQNSDGSWGLGHLNPHWLGKDCISSTLACILALKTWNVGDLHIRKGLHFIEKNSSYIMDEKSEAPVGFNIIFPGMIRLGIDLGLEFPIKQIDFDQIFLLREMELQRITNGDNMALGKKAYMAYIAEGLTDVLEWGDVLTYQRKNGSLFNSPSATSAFAIHSHNTNALKYLEFLGNEFVDSAPMAYPLNISSQLFLVDILENMGISHRFSCEIKNILDMTYRSLMQNSDDIIMDMETCAMGFRMLRMHGYNISCDVFSIFAEESRFHDSVEVHLNDTKALLELYKASLVRITENEGILESIGSWSGKLLKQQLCSNRVSRSISLQQVEYALKSEFYSATTLEPLKHKRNIECFGTAGIRMQKSAYLACDATENILALATKDFHLSQSIYQQELQYLERWVKKVGLDRLKFARAMSLDVFVFMASHVFPSELYDASMAWIQNSILTTVVDDFFDGGGSTKELRNFITLIEKWDMNAGIEFCSEDVEILFRAVYDTNNQIAEIAAKVQNRNVVDHIAEVWGNLVNAFMVEAEWTTKGHVPTMEEYMSVAEVSIALGVVVAPSLYLLGPKLSDDMIRDPEYKDMLRNMRFGFRLINDIGTYKKEMSEGYVNSVLLCAVGDDPMMAPASIEMAMRKIQALIKESERELLRLVLSEGGAIPRPCKDIFWNTYKIGQRFYSDGDGFRMPQKLVAAVNKVVHQPLLQTPSRS